mgnify:FL=1
MRQQGEVTKPMKKSLILILCLTFLFPAAAALGKVDLVTLPEREKVQLTIYNSADLTLVRDMRPLTLRRGENRLQFSWANTLIDPTSLHMEPKEQAGRIDIFDITYPPRTKELGLWHLRSQVSGKVPVEITYFTSGLSWQAFYLGTLTPDEQQMKLEGYVRVTNRSGEDYENAQTRLVVGKINLLDQIAELARRQQPYGKPGMELPAEEAEELKRARPQARRMLAEAAVAADAIKKEITKEGLSEYFLYTIEGTETIPDGWSKRLPSFDADEVDVESLYKFDEQRWGRRTLRFLKFANDEEHNLGETPLPGGLIKVFRTVDRRAQLSYVGADGTKYIPVDQKVELNLGPARKVQVEPKVMDYRKENIVFDSERNVNGFDEVREYLIELKNHRDLPVTVEVTRNFEHHWWDLRNMQLPDRTDYERVDQDTVRYTVPMEPHTQADLRYELTLYQGERRFRR